MMTNDDIEHAVLRQLAWDSHVEVAEVEVEVTAGVVTLTGVAASYGEK